MTPANPLVAVPPPLSGIVATVAPLATAAYNATAAALHKEASQHAAQHSHFQLDPMHSFMAFNPSGAWEPSKPFVIPVLGLLVGGVMMSVPRTATVGKLVLYFGAQSFMNIYMGWVMRTSVTVPAGFQLANGDILENDLTGCPAGFALTAMQQVISFIIFIVFFSALYYTPHRYTPKPLGSFCELVCVIIFGWVFALNIALNNFSLGYISIAVNLIIRSCLPLSTFLSQQALALCGYYRYKPCRVKELLLMVIGVVCAGVFVGAKMLGAKRSLGEEASTFEMVLGEAMCVLSLLCGSLNLALAGVLGETKLNVLDTVAYMAIPATLFLLPIACFLQKPVPAAWAEVFNKSHMTDWEILAGVWSLNKTTMCWLVLSGFFSFAYNIVQFSIVHTLSPSATAFGGNFNKAALIFLTLILPFLRVHELPDMPYIAVIWIAVILNICAFSYYGYLQIEAKKEAAQMQYAPEVDDESSGYTEESSDDESQQTGGKRSPDGKYL